MWINGEYIGSVFLLITKTYGYWKYTFSHFKGDYACEGLGHIGVYDEEDGNNSE